MISAPVDPTIPLIASNNNENNSGGIVLNNLDKFLNRVGSGRGTRRAVARLVKKQRSLSLDSGSAPNQNPMLLDRPRAESLPSISPEVLNEALLGAGLNIT